MEYQVQRRSLHEDFIQAFPARRTVNNDSRGKDRLWRRPLHLTERIQLHGNEWLVLDRFEGLLGRCEEDFQLYDPKARVSVERILFFQDSEHVVGLLGGVTQVEDGHDSRTVFPLLMEATHGAGEGVFLFSQVEGLCQQEIPLSCFLYDK